MGIGTRLLTLLLYANENWKKMELKRTFMDGPSTVFCVAVVAWIVVIKPSTIPKLSFIILANGAKQLVVHDALLYKEKFFLVKI